ncbi:MAG: dual specificity protein phosphatase [Chloroflexota bacterium]
MNQIRPWLYIGKYRETLDSRLLAMFNISAMLLLAELVEHEGITSRYLAVEDGQTLSADLLQEGVAFVREQKEQGGIVLVACGAGISRAATFVTAVLREVEGLPLREAFAVVQQAHPDAMPHMALWDSLCHYYDEPIPWIEIA